MSILNTATWQRIKQTLEEDRKDLLEGLVSANNEARTNLVRGKIQQIDDILQGYPVRISNTDT